MNPRTAAIAFVLLATAGNDVLAEGRRTVILATGRRDPRIFAIDLREALDARNQGTPNAIVARSKVALDRLDGKRVGDSANIVVSEDGKTAFVVNHHGSIDNDEFLQHGGRGNIAVMDVAQMTRQKNDDTANALERHLDAGSFGAVGLVLLPDLFVIGTAESHLTEDGGNRITFVDRRTGSLRGQVELAVGRPGVTCPDFPVPFVSPHGPPVPPVAILSPNPSWGCFPDTNGIALAHGSDGKAYLFTGNGGTDDVSVIDLERALAGERTPEIARIPTQTGPFGVAASPDGRFVVSANRESQRTGVEGNTISIIDVDRARLAAPGAEIARVLVGTDSPATATRPFLPSFTPDGREIIVPNFRSNNVSIVDLRRAVDHQPGAEVARIALTRPDGGPARPKGSAVTADGRFAVVSGGARGAAGGGTVWVIDLRSRAVVGTVTGVGNDPYGIAVVERRD
ncbi:MAG: YncE family protein [Myxococcales bacterium]